MKKVQPEGYMWPAADSPDYASGTVSLSLIAGIHMRNNTLALKLEQNSKLSS
jgi:hypothetical protein